MGRSGGTPLNTLKRPNKAFARPNIPQQASPQSYKKLINKEAFCPIKQQRISSTPLMKKMQEASQAQKRTFFGIFAGRKEKSSEERLREEQDPLKNFLATLKETGEFPTLYVEPMRQFISYLGTLKNFESEKNNPDSDVFFINKAFSNLASMQHLLEQEQDADLINFIGTHYPDVMTAAIKTSSQKKQLEYHLARAIVEANLYQTNKKLRAYVLDNPYVAFFAALYLESRFKKDDPKAIDFLLELAIRFPLIQMEIEEQIRDQYVQKLFESLAENTKNEKMIPFMKYGKTFNPRMNHSMHINDLIVGRAKDENELDTYLRLKPVLSAITLINADKKLIEGLIKHNPEMLTRFNPYGLNLLTIESKKINPDKEKIKLLEAMGLKEQSSLPDGSTVEKIIIEKDKIIIRGLGAGRYKNDWGVELKDLSKTSSAFFNGDSGY